jgi:hypothetical protein
MFVLIGALFIGAPSGISQRWPGIPCFGLTAAVFVVAGGAGLMAIAGVAVIVCCLLESAAAGTTGAENDGVGGAVVVALFSLPELWQAVKASARTAKPNIFFMNQ